MNNIDYRDSIFVDDRQIEYMVVLTHDLDDEFYEFYKYLNINNIDNMIVVYQKGDYPKYGSFKDIFIRNSCGKRLHAKVIFMAYKNNNKETRHISVITSANMTGCAFKENLEIMWKRDDIGKADPILKEIASFLYGIMSAQKLRTNSQKAILNQLKQIGGERQSPGSVTIINGNNKSLQKHIEQAKKLYIISPFYAGPDEAANVEFIKTGVKRKKCYFITNESSSLSGKYFKYNTNARLYIIEGRTLHAKMYLLMDKGGKWKMIAGSSNYTHGGLFNNYEANVLVNNLTKKEIDQIIRIKGKTGRLFGEKLKMVETKDIVYKSTKRNEPGITIEEQIKEWLYRNIVWDEHPKIIKNNCIIKVDFRAIYQHNKYGIKSLLINYNGQNVFISNKKHKTYNLEVTEDCNLGKEEIIIRITARRQADPKRIDLNLLSVLANATPEGFRGQVDSIIYGAEYIKRKSAAKSNAAGKQRVVNEAEPISSGRNYVLEIATYLTKLEMAENGILSNPQLKEIQKLKQIIANENNEDNEKELGGFRQTILNRIDRIIGDNGKIRT